MKNIIKGNLNDTFDLSSCPCSHYNLLLTNLSNRIFLAYIYNRYAKYSRLIRLTKCRFYYDHMFPLALSIINTCEYGPFDETRKMRWYDWELYIECQDSEFWEEIQAVVYHLHPSFPVTNLHDLIH